ncbi:hypothetical protein C2S52_018767 [Perilla frutescens var. hirtella]|uniref:Uncharacterized protein n=1 Tax=Perilla frutescens var. hirtella TaxID=608512 RepID=A0AAD4JE44_PERFH|nr:hypothetical protein C2S52_018767 [Perilla frutescens var. hirtella]KAH6831754.1 hypothetical protein C2S53_008373 [Perilla frutescens var. hirtella]
MPPTRPWRTSVLQERTSSTLECSRVVERNTPSHFQAPIRARSHRNSGDCKNSVGFLRGGRLPCVVWGSLTRELA